MKFLVVLATAALTLSALPALAYVGPGAGLSLLGAFWGLLVAVLAALAFVVLYPIRRLVRARKRPVEAQPSNVSEGCSDAAEDRASFPGSQTSAPSKPTQAA